MKKKILFAYTIGIFSIFLIISFIWYYAPNLFPAYYLPVYENPFRSAIESNRIVFIQGESLLIRSSNTVVGITYNSRSSRGDSRFTVYRLSDGYNEKIVLLRNRIWWRRDLTAPSTGFIGTPLSGNRFLDVDIMQFKLEWPMSLIPLSSSVVEVALIGRTNPCQIDIHDLSLKWNVIKGVGASGIDGNGLRDSWDGNPAF